MTFKRMYVYVITDPTYNTQNRYKIGITSKTSRGLTRDYLRYLPEVQIIYFRACPQASWVEAKVKKLLRPSFIRNVNGHRSEWLIYDFPKLARLLNHLIDGRTKSDLSQLRRYYRRLGGTRQLRSELSLIKAIQKLGPNRVPPTVQRLINGTRST